MPKTTTESNYFCFIHGVTKMQTIKNVEKIYEEAFRSLKPHILQNYQQFHTNHDDMVNILDKIGEVCIREDDFETEDDNSEDEDDSGHIYSCYDPGKSLSQNCGLETDADFTTANTVAFSTIYQGCRDLDIR